MNKKYIGIIAVISILIVCTASVGYIAYRIGSAVWKDRFDTEWENEYGYELKYSATDELYNISLYLPIPMKDGEPHSLANEMANRFSEENWTSEIIDTERGKMLKISREKISKDTLTLGVFFILGKKTTHSIDTKNPMENEPLFSPRVNASSTNFQSYIYAIYNSSDDAKLTINITFQGGKHRGGIWGVTLMKYYRDEVNYVIIGESDGWHLVNGTLEIKG